METVLFIVNRILLAFFVIWSMLFLDFRLLLIITLHLPASSLNHYAYQNLDVFTMSHPKLCLNLCHREIKRIQISFLISTFRGNNSCLLPLLSSETWTLFCALPNLRQMAARKSRDLVNSLQSWVVTFFGGMAVNTQVAPTFLTFLCLSLSILLRRFYYFRMGDSQ
jgi:hypothetical protein